MTKTHIVKQGECLSSIAKKYGFADWRKIYNHPQNAAFKQKRPNPNLIYPGDKLVIPDKEPKEIGGQTDQRHRFRRTAETTLLRLVMQDEEGKPISGGTYRLDVEGITYEGTTEDGLLEREIPSDAEQGYVTVWPGGKIAGEGCSWQLKIGHLDPVECLTGVQARLNNLGFHCGAVDGIFGPKTEAAVQAFQKSYGLTVDGIPGPQTQGKLTELHGC